MATARKKGRGYELRVFCGYDMNGKKIEKSKTWIPPQGMTPKQLTKELKRQKVLFEEEIKTGINPDDNMKLHAFSDRWLKEYAEIQLAPKTVIRYKDYLKNINQAMGHMKLRDIKAFHLNKFYRNLEEEGMNKRAKKDKNGNIKNGKLAPKTILEHHRLISKILSTAVKWQLLESNVAFRADPPKVPYKEMAYLNEEQTKRMIALLEDEPIQYKTMITLLIFTGLRRGELCGLEWNGMEGH